MRITDVIAVAAAVLLILLAAAQAQDTLYGARQGPEGGADAPGQPGGIIGGTVGAATGTIAEMFGVEGRPRFQSYVARDRVPSYRCDDELSLGPVLPHSGATYRQFRAVYRGRGNRYRLRNDPALVVDPQTGRIVDVID